MSLGRVARREIVVSHALVDSFAKLTGDANPIHLDARFAQAHGLSGPIAHGLLFGALAAALVGSELPGPGALIQKVDLAFHRPCLVGQTIAVQLTVREVHESVATWILDLRVEDAAGGLLARGRLQVGTTSA